MSFIKNCTQIFMTRILQIVLISDNKNTVSYAVIMQMF